MTLRSAPTPSSTTTTTRRRPAARPPAARPPAARPPAARPPAAPPPEERALDEALDHIGQLAERLWAVRRLHVPARRRARFTPGARVRCAGCGQEMPCPTLRAAAA